MVKLQDLALETKQLARQRDQQGAACKEAKGLASRIKSRQRVMRKLMDEMNLWNRLLDGGAQKDMFTEEEVAKALELGIVPETRAALLNAASSTIGLGKQYYFVTNDLERCVEEQGLLGQERRRLCKWVTYVLARCEQRLQALGDEGQVPVVSLPGAVPAERAVLVIEKYVHERARSSGIAFHLRRHMRSLECMKKQLGIDDRV
jgi:hypothetical protein